MIVYLDLRRRKNIWISYTHCNNNFFRIITSDDSQIMRDRTNDNSDFHLRFKRINACSVVAGGGRFPLPTNPAGWENVPDAAVAMLLLAWHVKRAVPAVRCRWFIIGCHRVRLVSNKLLTVTAAVERSFGDLSRCPRTLPSWIKSYVESNTAFS